MGNSIYQVLPAENGSSLYFVYINLAHRTDRRQQMEAEYQRIGISQYHRFDAIKRDPGCIGCSLSHIEALKLGIASGAAHIVVFEDDFELVASPEEFHELLQTLPSIDYDVITLHQSTIQPGAVLRTNHPLLNRITGSWGTGGLIVNKKYAPTLLNNFTTGSILLQRFPKNDIFNVDSFKIMLEKLTKQIKMALSMLIILNTPLK